jgi:hypothetical protein
MVTKIAGAPLNKNGHKKVTLINLTKWLYERWPLTKVAATKFIVALKRNPIKRGPIKSGPKSWSIKRWP